MDKLAQIKEWIIDGAFSPDDLVEISQIADGELKSSKEHQEVLERLGISKLTFSDYLRTEDEEIINTSPLCVLLEENEIVSIQEFPNLEELTDELLYNEDIKAVFKDGKYQEEYVALKTVVFPDNEQLWNALNPVDE